MFCLFVCLFLYVRNHIPGKQITSIFSYGSFLGTAQQHVRSTAAVGGIGTVGAIGSAVPGMIVPLALIDPALSAGGCSLECTARGVLWALSSG